MSVPLPDLIGHMREHYADRHIMEDLGSVLACCGSDEDREAVRGYAKARRKAPGFKGHSYLDNSHKHIDPVALGKILDAKPARQAICESCHRGFIPERSTARFCSGLCRKRHSRRACHAKPLSAAGQTV